MNRDYIRQIQMIELREFTDNLINRVEELRSELKNYGSVSLGREVLIFTIVKNVLYLGREKPARLGRHLRFARAITPLECVGVVALD